MRHFHQYLVLCFSFCALFAHHALAQSGWTELNDLKNDNGILTATVDSNIAACRIECTSGEILLKKATLKGPDTTITIQATFKTGQSTSFAVDPSAPVSSIALSHSGEGAVKILVKKVTVTIPSDDGSNNAQNLKDGGWQEISTITRKGGTAEIQTDINASQLLVKCSSGRVIINTIMVNEATGSKTLPVAGVYAAGESEVVNIGSLKSLIGLRISHGGKGSYTIYGRP